MLYCVYLSVRSICFCGPLVGFLISEFPSTVSSRRSELKTRVRLCQVPSDILRECSNSLKPFPWSISNRSLPLYILHSSGHINKSVLNQFFKIKISKTYNVLFVFSKPLIDKRVH